MKLILMISSFLLCTLCLAQQEDNVWLVGVAAAAKWNPKSIKDSTTGITKLEFSYSPVKIFYDSSLLVNIKPTNASICDEEGKMLAYTNGMAIWDAKHQYVEDTINFNEYWLNNVYYQDGDYAEFGLPFIQGALMLPMEGSIFTVYQQYQSWENITDRVFYVSFKTLGDNTFSSVNHDQLVILDSLGTGRLNAIRHSNGRDWWVVFPEIHRNIYFVSLLSLRIIKLDFEFKLSSITKHRVYAYFL